MNPKPVVPRTLAIQDVEDAIGYYLKKDARQAALAFVDALEDAYAILGRHPGIGSARYATELQVPGLRSWSLPRFPYVVFYAERDDHIDVWRVLQDPAGHPFCITTMIPEV